MVFNQDLGGGGLTETTPLIVKYIHKGNIYYLVEKLVKKIAIRRRHISIGGGQRGMVEDHTFKFYLDLL